ncbi:MAG: prepilin-type N-terminal cleavage/methylation domain-containing protein, partial [Lysobacterales bacterium]
MSDTNAAAATMRRQASGFTLVELLITIAVVA